MQCAPLRPIQNAPSTFPSAQRMRLDNRRVCRGVPSRARPFGEMSIFLSLLLSVHSPLRPRSRSRSRRHSCPRSCSPHSRSRSRPARRRRRRSASASSLAISRSSLRASASNAAGLCRAALGPFSLPRGLLVPFFTCSSSSSSSDEEDEEDDEDVRRVSCFVHVISAATPGPMRAPCSNMNMMRAPRPVPGECAPRPRVRRARRRMPRAGRADAS